MRYWRPHRGRVTDRRNANAIEYTMASAASANIYAAFDIMSDLFEVIICLQPCILPCWFLLALVVRVHLDEFDWRTHNSMFANPNCNNVRIYDVVTVTTDMIWLAYSSPPYIAATSAQNHGHSFRYVTTCVWVAKHQIIVKLWANIIMIAK